MSDGARIHLKAWRDLGGNPGKEVRCVGRHRLIEIGNDAAPLAAVALVENRDPGLEAGAMFCESAARHCACEDQMRGLGEAAEGLGPGGRVRRETGTGDCDQTPAGGQTRKG